MGLTAHMGSGNEMPIPIQVKPQTAKQTVNPLETIRTSRDRFQFIVDPFDKTTAGSFVKIVGNFSQMVAEGLEKFVKTGERTAFHLSAHFSKRCRPSARLKSMLKMAVSSSRRV